MMMNRCPNFCKRYSPKGISVTAISPYPGLRPFRQDEARWFFGREAQIDDVLSRLEESRFLAIVGTSGCGKSSLVRAGLIPVLEQGFLTHALPKWRIAITQPGSTPFENLTEALLGETALGPEHHADDAAASLEATLRGGPLGLLEAVTESHLPDNINLLLLVDQFEEIFRYRHETASNDADAFVSLLLTTAKSRQSRVPIYVVLTMRSDFIGDCALFSGLPEAINDSQFLTPRLSRAQYRDAIVKPAHEANGQLSDRLVNRLLNDLRGEPDQLPVLQHLLMRMWTQAAQQGSTRELTIEEYETAGGLAGALSKHCDEILKQALNPDQQLIAEAMFRALCERGADQKDTRRPVQLREVVDIAGAELNAVIPVVEAFRGEGRNFIVKASQGSDIILDISHESLIRHWRTLNKWVEAEAESTRVYKRLEDAAKRRQEGEGAELWRGVDLRIARQWEDREMPSEAWAARYGDAYGLAMAFLRESDQQEKEEEQQKEEEQRQKEERQRREFDKARARAKEQTDIAEKEARNARMFQIFTMVIGALLIVAIGLIIYGVSATQAKARAEYESSLAISDAERAGQKAQEERQKAKRSTQTAQVHQKRARVSLSRHFSAVSRAMAIPKPPLSVLLGLEAINASPRLEAVEALNHALTNIGGIPLVGHEDAVLAVAFSPDGKHIATVSRDKTVRIWNARQPTSEPITLVGHEDDVLGVAFSPDGNQIATVSWDRTVRIWNPKQPTNKPIILNGHAGPVWGVAFSSDGNQIVTASGDKTARVWNLKQPQAKPIVLTGHAERVTGAAFSPNRERIATVSDDKTIRIWNTKQLSPPIMILTGHEEAITGLAYSRPDGNHLATISTDKTVRIWNLSRPEDDPTILKGHTDSILGIAYSPDGHQIATASNDGTVRIWDPMRPEWYPTILRGHEGDVRDVAYSPDGNQIVTVSWDHSVRLWHTAQPQAEPTALRRVFQGHQDFIYDMTFSPDGHHMATVSKDKTVRIWNLLSHTDKPIILKGHTEAVVGVAYSPDGNSVATASWDNTVRIWNLKQPETEPIVLRGHEAYVFDVAFSPDGSRVASVSSDKSVKIWNPKQPLAKPTTLQGHQSDVLSTRTEVLNHFLGNVP